MALGATRRRSWLRDTKKLADLATIATTLIAFVALGVAIAQIRSANASESEATAEAVYKDYLKLAVEQPELAEGLHDVSADPVKQARYSWFVSYFLHSAEHIYLTYPHNNEWRAAISNQVCLHQRFLRGNEYQRNLKLHYDAAFRNLVDDALSRCPDAQ